MVIRGKVRLRLAGSSWMIRHVFTHVGHGDELKELRNILTLFYSTSLTNFVTFACCDSVVSFSTHRSSELGQTPHPN